MIDEYSISIGLVLGAALVGTYYYGRQVGEARRDQEIARMNRAATDFDRYYGEREAAEPLAIAFRAAGEKVRGQ